MLRRFGGNSNKIVFKNLEVDLDEKQVLVDGNIKEFTALEYKILLLLLNNLNKTVTREQILDKIWDVAGNFVNDNTLTVYIKRIREKLGNEDIIKTVKGIGYKVEDK